MLDNEQQSRSERGILLMKWCFGSGDGHNNCKPAALVALYSENYDTGMQG